MSKLSQLQSLSDKLKATSSADLKEPGTLLSVHEAAAALSEYATALSTLKSLLSELQVIPHIITSEYFTSAEAKKAEVDLLIKTYSQALSNIIGK